MHCFEDSYSSGTERSRESSVEEKLAKSSRAVTWWHRQKGSNRFLIINILVVIKGRDFGLALGSGWEVSSGCCGGYIRGEGLERWGLQRQQDGGCFSLGKTEISIE